MTADALPLTSENSARRRQGRATLIAVVIFAALSLLCAVTSEGFLEADACTHYLYARFAFEQPYFFVNVWGRPICTAVYSIPAMIGGRLGARVMSMLLAVGCGLAAQRIARKQGYPIPVLALIFTLGQPLLFLHSFSELTELPFAFLVALAFLAYQARQWLAMAIVVGLMPLSRPEGFGFLLLAAAALILHRRLWWLPILAIPTIGWDYVGWVLYGRDGAWWKWLSENWPYAADSLYQRGSIFHFIMLLPAVVSPFVFPATLIGIGCTMKSISAKVWRDHRRTCDVLIALVPLTILIGHSVLYAAGKMASNGEARYMIVVAPLWGVLGARGWDVLAAHAPRIGTRLQWATFAALFPIACNVYYKVVPLRYDDDWQRARRVAVWYENSPLRDSFPRVATAHQAIYYFMGISNTDRNHALEWKQDVLSKTTPGTIVVWDPIYAIYNSDAKRKVPVESLVSAGWIDVTGKVPSIGKGWHVLISPTDSSGHRSSLAAEGAATLPSSPSSP